MLRTRLKLLTMAAQKMPSAFLPSPFSLLSLYNRPFIKTKNCC
ncbi:hypothetical protein MICAI_3180036 [Microcystis sp. T1-4]|nr:hypothetical protein MICAI_3180036 [Microcystis sp. T1-4]